MPHIAEMVFVVILLLLAAILFITLRNSKRKKQLIDSIRKSWGKKPSYEYKNRELESVATYFENLKSHGPDHFIDNITWNDLDMDSVYKSINCSLTTVGDEFLYSLLRLPSFCDAELAERTGLIEYFTKNTAEREKVQFILANLGKRPFTSVSDYFLSEEKKPTIRGSYYKLLSLALLLAPLLFFINPGFGILATIAMLLTNMTVYYRAKNELSSNLESLGYIVNLIGCGRKIGNLQLEGVQNKCRILKESSGNIKGISINSFYSLFYQTEDPILEYIKVVFLGELIAYESVLKIIYKNRDKIKLIYETIGLLDSLISAASYRESLSCWCLPHIEQSQPGNSFITASGIYHPLLIHPVSNPADFKKSVLLTGSNASGKSTFLKTVGINSIFAQSICTCLAESYSSSYFAVYSSMALKDSIADNESYFVVEIKSLKRIFDRLSGKIPCLCLIDEVLRGTNTVERISASSEVLYRMASGNTLCLAATHDIELTYILEEFMDNYHFMETLTENEIKFDYKIYPGRSNTRNAIKLLKLMGYEETIVQRAQDRAGQYMETGNWNRIKLN